MWCERRGSHTASFIHEGVISHQMSWTSFCGTFLFWEFAVNLAEKNVRTQRKDCLGHNVHIRERHWNVFAEHDFMTKWKLVYRKIHPLKLFSMEVQYVRSNKRKKTVPRYFFSLIGLKLSGRNCETINCAFLSGLHSLKEVQWWPACAASHNLSLCFSQPLFISFFN